MNVNATLFVQLVVFFILSWFTMKCIWPPLVKVLDERVRAVAEGMAQSQRAKEEWARAQEDARQTVHAAQLQAAEIYHTAQHQASAVLDQARVEATSLMMTARLHAEKEAQVVLEQVRTQLRVELSQLIVLGVQRVLQQEIDAQKHADLLRSLTDTLQS